MDEREQILTAVFGCGRAGLYVDRTPLTPAQQQACESMFERRSKGEPLQYILGNCEFMGLVFVVDERVLIPRPETEILIEAVVARASASRRFLRVLDIGTGSGNIAVSVAHSIRSCMVTATDISPAALEVARTNARHHGVEEKISFVCADLWPAAHTDAAPQFDIIISNPPYIATAAIDTLPVDVRREPRVALDGGTDGLRFYRAIIEGAYRHMSEGALIYFEVGDGQKAAVEELLLNAGNFEIIEWIPDYCGTPRVVVAQARKSHG